MDPELIFTVVIFLLGVAAFGGVLGWLLHWLFSLTR
jgi:hypothetical protein